jgi:biopolymer transport protein TolR
MAMNLGSAGKGPQPTINITPLVDVVLVLLIIFMVVTPLLTKHFSTRVPEAPDSAARGADDGGDDAIVVRLDARGGVTLNSAQVALPALTTALGQVFQTRKERIVFFDADDDALFGDAVDVLDATRAGGAEAIAIATEPIATPM